MLDLCLKGHAEERVVVLVNTRQVRLCAATDDGNESLVVRAQSLASLADVFTVRLFQNMCGNVMFYTCLQY